MESKTPTLAFLKRSRYEPETWVPTSLVDGCANEQPAHT